MRELRSGSSPRGFEGPARTRYVGGTTSENIDYFDAVTDPAPLVFAFVLGLTFVLLTVAFRSIVIALKAIILNLLSVGAAYGLLVLVFQEGVGADLLGFTQVDAIEAWVPLFLFSVLFGLSMDYQVFLLSRIRERYDQTARHSRGGPLGRRLDRADHHGRGADHRRRVLRLRPRRPRHVPADGLRRRRRAAHRRHDHPLGGDAEPDGAARRPELVPAEWLEWLPHLEVEGHAAKEK